MTTAATITGVDFNRQKDSAPRRAQANGLALGVQCADGCGAVAKLKCGYCNRTTCYTCADRPREPRTRCLSKRNLSRKCRSL